VAKLLEVDSDDLYRNLLKPKIKVGNEFVTQGRNRDQESIDSLINDVKFDALFTNAIFLFTVQ
jgi:myosin heavy chain 6/7